MSGPPQWAIDTLAEAWAGRPTPVPELTWRRSRGRRYSSGFTPHGGHRVVVTAGTKAPRWEQRMILLHETAHAMCPREEHHGEMFWHTAWTLYRRFGLPIRLVLRHEEGYRKAARLGYLATRPGVSDGKGLPVLAAATPTPTSDSC